MKTQLMPKKIWITPELQILATDEVNGGPRAGHFEKNPSTAYSTGHGPLFKLHLPNGAAYGGVSPKIAYQS